MNIISLLTLLLIFGLLGGFVYLITNTKWLLFNRAIWQADNPKKHALLSIFSVSLGLFLIILVFLYVPYLSRDTASTTYITSQQLLITALSLAPALMMMVYLKEPFSSIGIGNNFFKSLSVGILLSIASLYHTNIDHVFSVQHIKLLPLFIIIGFGEEILIRAYLQQRLIAWLGVSKGIIIASLLMVIMHMPQHIIIYEQAITEALIALIWIIPVSGLLGFVMWRTGNLAAPGIFHAFINWSNNAIN